MQSQSKNNVRRRGVILTALGSRKLNQAKAETEIEQNFKRYTLESLSEETGLTPTTLSKVFTGSAGVDKRTLNCCFDTFNLTLLKDDYLYLKPTQDNLAESACDSPLETLRDRRSAEQRCKPRRCFADRSNTPQTHKMDQPQDDLQPRPPTAPGGQMPLDSVFYFDRPILESLCYEAIGQPGTMVNIRAIKQMGKTSLMTRILARARSLGYHIASVSLQLADGEILQHLESFLKWFCARVSKQLGLSNAIAGGALSAIADFWDNYMGSKANATDYFEDVLLANLDHPLTIAIDELNQLFAYPDIACEFLLLLRTWSEKAKAWLLLF